MIRMQGEPGLLSLGSSEGPGLQTQVLQKALVLVPRALPGWSGVAISGPSHSIFNGSDMRSGMLNSVKFNVSLEEPDDASPFGSSFYDD